VEEEGNGGTSLPLVWGNFGEEFDFWAEEFRDAVIWVLEAWGEAEAEDGEVETEEGGVWGIMFEGLGEGGSGGDGVGGRGARWRFGVEMEMRGEDGAEELEFGLEGEDLLGRGDIHWV
jgi:hypothetical protein